MVGQTNINACRVSELNNQKSDKQIDYILQKVVVEKVLFNMV